METTSPGEPAPIATPPAGDPTKVFGRRVVASVIDGVVVLAPVTAIVWSGMEYADEDARSELGMIGDPDDFCEEYLEQYDGVCVNLDGTVYYDEPSGAAFLTLAGLTIGIYVLLQGLVGWTIGKLLLRLRCVGEDGRRPGIGKALLRWLLWIVDGIPGIPLVGFITGLTSVGHRRVGDMVAKTYVVDAAAAGSPIVVPGAVAPPGAAAPAAPAAASPTEATGWPGTPAPTTPPPVATPSAPTAKPGPQWDEQRRTYIQWDPELRLWMQWDDTAKTWNAIPNQTQ